jgi:eukaryotic-like serine/threonine-protein kinase
MVINERYEVIDDSHGEGGFGKVSKHRDKALDRFVAVKQLRILKDAEAAERFKREAKALARMSHPNIPAIYDVQFSEDQMYILFENPSSMMAI